MDMLQANVEQQKNAAVPLDDQKELSDDALTKLLDEIGEVGWIDLLSIFFTKDRGSRTIHPFYLILTI